MAFEKDPNEIGALWLRSGQKGDYMTGEINGVKVVCFAVKSQSEKAPTWRVLKSVPRDTPPPAPVAFEKDHNEIGALWMKRGAKGDYMTGTVNGERIVCFAAKRGSDKSPDWRVLKSVPRDAPPPAPAPSIDAEDIPF